MIVTEEHVELYRSAFTRAIESVGADGPDEADLAALQAVANKLHAEHVVPIEQALAASEAEVAKLARAFELARRVVQAWREPGPRPDYHAAEQRDLERRWPVLATAIKNLAAYR